ncbi:MAG TPA: D-glycerate dehydrogenase [Candidatus Sulfotelmatobacter sp.]|nr:D-glycerate dehydrogenase [Candidatus Sulfotelmatobacter sp.]
MPPKVLVSRRLPPAALEILARHCDVDHNEPNRPLPRAEFLARLRGCQGLVCLLTDVVDDEVLSTPGLKIVSNVAVGFNNIDVAAATRRRVLATNTPGVLDDTTADLAFALLMATARRIVEADRFLRSGRWQGWDLLQFLGHDIHGKTLGICGLGRIGKAVARRARGFDMRLLYTDVQRAPEAVERELNVTFVDKDALLREADFVTIHVPLFPETRHYISDRELNLMKPTAILVNAARGPIVDEAALARALKQQRIAGAGLDVYEEEPKVHPGLLGLDTVVLLPHIASASVETRTRMATMAAENVVAGIAGRRPPNLLNPEAFG